MADRIADPEYQDPTAFFARTYLTEGLRTLCWWERSAVCQVKVATR